ncbi:hypothetical protein D3C85_747310 [compost metagenome]
MDFKIKAYKGRDGLTVVFAALEISKRWNRLRTGQIQVAKLLTGTFKRDCSNLEVLYISGGAWDGKLIPDPKYLPEGELEEVQLTPAQINRVKNPHARCRA